MGTEHFDAIAATYEDKPHRVAMALGVAAAIRENVPLNPDMDLLDFGCGTGILARELGPHVGNITCADTSIGMLEELRKKAHEMGLDTINLLHLIPENQYSLSGEYDAIVCNMTLHHIEHIDPVFQKFYKHLRKGGWIALADLDAEDGSFHEDHEGIYHFGFERQAFKAKLAECGFCELRDVTALKLSHGERGGKIYPIFLIAGRKL